MSASTLRKARFLLLMRFSDATAELDGLPGLRVHRSWWIAEGAADFIQTFCVHSRVSRRRFDGADI
jgi:hypothetical protein